ncbi:MAG: HAMP domain-containing histidine kinase [Erysipelotrichaceae bacterium]|nr:HAMP domain-containing histidine kinase [Erysipelotrichaceae bacterium]
MKKLLQGGFRKLSLTQQVMVLILLMLGFLTVFFVFFLSDNISSTISQQMFDMMSSHQQPIISALQNGESSQTDRQMLKYLAADSLQATGVAGPDGTMMLSREPDLSSQAAQEFQKYLTQRAEAMLADHSGRSGIQMVEQDAVTFNKQQFYYRMVKVQDKSSGKDLVVFTYMNDRYALHLRTTLMDTTVYVTVLAFFLILMIFVFWVFSIIHPLNQIKSYIAQIKQGKEVDLYINRDDEIGDVGKELRTLTAELAKQEKSKQEMMHNISHDLKTPIATIKSYSESIKDGIYPYGDLESSIDVILDNAQRLEHKVHNLLYMNRVEYLVSSDAEGVVTDMKDVVEQVVLNSAVIKPEIRIITDVEEVFFDGLLESWRVCLENIMENAFRYAKTYIKIVVRENELKICNDGPKMPEDRIESLFKPFVMGTGGRFGLGLSIVSKVVNANGYKVEGLNTDDGVCFRIWRDVPKPRQNRFNFPGKQDDKKDKKDRKKEKKG